MLSAIACVEHCRGSFESQIIDLTSCWLSQAIKKGLETCLQELQMHFLSPVCVSMYNKDVEAALRSADSRPEHDMRDHDALRDGCQFLLIAAEVLQSQRETVVRLLFNEVRPPNRVGAKRRVYLCSLHRNHSWLEKSSIASKIEDTLLAFTTIRGAVSHAGIISSMTSLLLLLLSPFRIRLLCAGALCGLFQQRPPSSSNLAEDCL